MLSSDIPLGLTAYFQEQWFLYFSLTILGLIAGSFATSLIYRLPLIIAQEADSTDQAERKSTHQAGFSSLSLSFPPSHCPRCKKRIAIHHNLPLIGYLLLRGRCANCKEVIAYYYPLTELLCLVLALLCAFIWGADIILIPILFLLWGLVALSIIDIRAGLLPDKITLSILWVGLICQPLMPYATLYQAVLGVILAYISLSLVNYLYFILRRRTGIGGGDIKLFATLGAYFGWQAFLPLLLFASILGIIFFYLVNLYLYLFATKLSSSLDNPAQSNSQKTQVSALQNKIAWGPAISCAAVLYLLLFYLRPDILEILQVGAQLQ